MARVNVHNITSSSCQFSVCFACSCSVLHVLSVIPFQFVRNCALIRTVIVRHIHWPMCACVHAEYMHMNDRKYITYMHKHIQLCAHMILCKRFFCIRVE